MNSIFCYSNKIYLYFSFNFHAYCFIKVTYRVEVQKNLRLTCPKISSIKENLID